MEGYLLGDDFSSCKTLLVNNVERFPEIVNKLREHGLFKCSRYDFKIKTLKMLVAFFLKDGKNVLSDDDIKYLKSLSSLYHLGCSINSVRKKILTSQKGIKDYLAFIEYMFHKVRMGLIPNFNIERFAEKVSMIYALRVEAGIVEQRNKLNMDVKAIREVLDILDEAEKIKRFKECEVLVDDFQYECIREKSNFLVKGDLEKYRKQGYIQAEISAWSDMYKNLDFIEKNGLDNSEWTIKICEKLSELFIETETHGVKRIVGSIPDERHFLRGLRELIKVKSLYSFEIDELMKLSKEIHEDIYRNLDVEIKNSQICFLDIVRFKRLFYFISISFGMALKKKFFDSLKEGTNLSEENIMIMLESVIPTMKESSFKMILKCLFGKRKADFLIRFFLWDGSKICDFQTQPLLLIKGNFFLMPCLISSSNLIRNNMERLAFRLDASEDITPLEDELELIFKTKCEFYEVNKEYHFGDYKGEIDFLTVIDGSLFIFECKNCLHPCGHFKLRTTYDHIKKAATQLDRFRALFLEDNGFKAYLSNIFKYDFTKLNGNLTTSIVMGNRMFSGYILSDSMIINTFELDRFVDSGLVITKRGNETINERCLWEGNNFRASDLEKYLGHHSYLRSRLNNLCNVNEYVEIMGKKLITETYQLDPDKYFEGVI